MADPELNRAEDSMKAKYLHIIKSMSHVELKKFNKNDYKKKVIRDMTKLLPSYEQTTFDGYAQCVSNAMQSEVQSLLKKRSRSHSTSEVLESPELSDTVLEDLNTSMHVENTVLSPEHKTQDDNSLDEEAGDNGEEEENNDDSLDCANDTQNSDTTNCLDESLTYLKQTVNESSPNTEDSVQPSRRDTGMKDRSKENTYKCSDECKINQKSKKNFDMIQSSMCMIWYHEKCVGISKNEPIGLWLCLTCREFPKIVQNKIKCTKDDVQELKNTTQLILNAVNKLSEKLESSIGGINDRLTAISKQVKTNDKHISESIQGVATATEKVKNIVEQKSCQILNKTITILDNVKPQSDNTILQKPQQNKLPVQNHNKVSNDQIQKDKNPKKNTQPGAVQPQTSKQKQTQQKPKTAPTKGAENAHPQVQQEEDIVDLTNDDRDKEFNEIRKTKIIKQSTLIAGSSLLKNLKVTDLNRSTAVRSVSGGTIDSLKSKLSEFNLDNCKTIILQVGGNDADDGTDLETFSNQYEQLLNTLKENDHRVIVSGLLPRETDDLRPFNEKLRQVCDTCEVEFIENYDNFLLASGELPDSYYQQDKLHLNKYGTKKLLSNIDNVHRVLAQVQPSGPNKPTYMYRMPSHQMHHRRPGSQNRPDNHKRWSPKYCHICMRNGHATQECWFNGRADGWSGRQMR